jgi:CheY-like chemotaxis protein
MKILIADDSEEKIGELEQYFHDKGYGIELGISRSFKETVSKAEGGQYDLVMLDMTMPTSSSKLKNKNTKRSLAGKDVLATLNYYSISPPKCIIFSQFSEFGRHDDISSLSEIYDDLFDTYSNFLCGYVIYDSTSDLWKDSLTKLIQEVFEV